MAAVTVIFFVHVHTHTDTHHWNEVFRFILNNNYMYILCKRFFFSLSFGIVQYYKLTNYFALVCVVHWIGSNKKKKKRFPGSQHTLLLLLALLTARLYDFLSMLRLIETVRTACGAKEYHLVISAVNSGTIIIIMIMKYHSQFLLLLWNQYFKFHNVA